ncbi:MAG: rplR [Parachlamydiales bacterium]|nr:rplR [Parachlamydiales bacterium]
MDNSQKRRRRARAARVMRVRGHIRGTPEKPRLSIFKSNQHLFAQLIDDVNRVTIAGIGTQSKANQKTAHNKKSKAAARSIGTEMAEIAKKKNIAMAVFDRGRYKFHGIIAEFANAAREAGLQF